MEVILREHVENLGRPGEVVKVAAGYARNFLLPRKLALLATPANKKVVERQRKIADAIEATERADAEALATRLSQVDIVMARRVGEHETLYGSVTSTDLVEDLAKKGFELDKRKVQLPEPLKQLGEHTVSVKLYLDVVAQLRVKIVALTEEPPAAAE
jgi:large subunit ribosomal protein L9